MAHQFLFEVEASLLKDEGKRGMCPTIEGYGTLLTASRKAIVWDLATLQKSGMSLFDLVCTSPGS